MFDRVICLSVLLVSANGAVGTLGRQHLYLGLLAALLVLWPWRGLLLARRDAVVVLVIAAISAAHLITLGLGVATASAGFLVRLGVALLAMRAVPSFHRHLVVVMTWAAALSFLFWVPVQLGIDLPRLLAFLRVPIPGSSIFHIGLHNFHVPEEAARNCGFFGEPGMFAGYLILAMVLALVERQRIGPWRWLVLVAALLSTQSTTGYVALAGVVITAIVSANLQEARRRGPQAVAVLLAVAVAARFAYAELPFLRNKIEHQVAVALEGVDSAKINRVGNLLYDLEYVAAKPALGWSPRTSARASLDPEIEEIASGQGNGLSGFAVKFGLVGLGACLLAAWRGFSAARGSALVGGLALATLVVVLLGEQFFDGALFLTTLFIQAQPSSPTPDASVELPCSALPA
jgi:hypothetical protein